MSLQRLMLPIAEILTSPSLQHKFEVELKDGTKQTRLSTLCEYGSTEPGGYSAMAKLG